MGFPSCGIIWDTFIGILATISSLLVRDHLMLNLPEVWSQLGFARHVTSHSMIASNSLRRKVEIQLSHLTLNHQARNVLDVS